MAEDMEKNLATRHSVAVFVRSFTLGAVRRSTST